MKLDENYRIEQDAANWILIYESEGDVNPKTGKRSISRDVSYHANLRQALTVYLDKNLKGSTDILDVKNRLVEAERKIAKMH
jgi:hypothetical protein